MPVDPSSRPRPAEHVVFRGLRDGGVLLHLETGQYHGVNAVGVVLWQLLDGDRSIEAVARLARDQLIDPPDDLADHVGEFVAALDQRGLVVVASG